MPTAQFPGGSFAPPLTDAMLATYRRLIDSVPAESELRGSLEVCYNCASQWWNAPESVGTSKQPHFSGVGTITPLDDSVKKSLWDHIPWEYEIEHFKKAFNAIEAPTLRDAAFHLLWFAAELCLEREPITNDKI